MARTDRPSGARSAPGARTSTLRASTRRVMRPSGPPTDEIPVWTAPDGVDRPMAQAVVDLAIRAGVAMLSTGAAAADVTATVLMLTRAYGLSSVHVDVTYTSVTVSYHRGPDADPMTVMRVVRFRVQDYTRLERLRALIVELTTQAPDERVDVGEARVRFDAVFRAPHPYRRWLTTTAGAALAGAAAGLVGAGWVIIAISFVTAGLATLVAERLGRAGVASFFTQCVGAAIPTVVATLVVVAQSHGVLTDVSPSLVVASGIVLLLAGLSVVGAAEDALSGYYVTAGARVFEVVVLSLGIAVGVSLVLSLGQRLGYPIAISTRTLVSDDVVVQVVCAVVISVAFAVMSYSSGRAVTAAGIAGALGWGILAVGERADLGATTSSALAALVIGFAARVIARRLALSALAVTTAAIVPLLPGRLTYEGISQIVTQPGGLGFTAGLPTLAAAAGTGLGLAAGVSLGTWFAGLVADRRAGVSAADRRATPVLSDTGELPAVPAQRSE